MAATPEAKVKKEVTKLLKLWGAYYFSPVTGGFGRSGVPDIVACINGDFIAIECKAGNNQPTELQKKNLQNIGMAGGWPWVVNESQVGEFRLWLATRYGDPDMWDGALKMAQTWFASKEQDTNNATKKAAKKTVKKAAAK